MRYCVFDAPRRNGYVTEKRYMTVTRDENDGGHLRGVCGDDDDDRAQ